MSPTDDAPAPLPGFATAPPAHPAALRQASLDELGTPLSEVTFVVVDLETTGTAAGSDAITEIGALKMRGGESLGTFETLVNPDVPIPPLITILTGITEAMLLPAPRISEVLPGFLEFAGGAVIVGHNVRFDVGFLDAALARHGYPRLANTLVDTLGLARRLLRDEVPNCKLGTIARHLRVPTSPNHRAYADAEATAQVFHALLERAATYGVLGLDDLVALPSMRAHPSASKLALTARLPRAPGVYLFRDRGGRVLYVGKATNLRSRVRSYFSGDNRRKVPQLLRETVGIDHYVCRDPLEAAVREVRLIQQLEPRFNKQAKAWRQYSYLRLTDDRFPRLAVTRLPGATDAPCLGPLPSARAAHVVREAIETAVPLRRCSRRIGRRTPLDAESPCVASQLGVASCPCSGAIGDSDYAALVDTVTRGLGAEPQLLLDPIEQRMRRLADARRFEEAAATRERLSSLARALRRSRLVAQLRGAERIVFDMPSGRYELARGRLLLAEGPGAMVVTDAAPPPAGPAARNEVDELLLVGRWLEKSAARLRLVSVDGVLASMLPVVSRYDPARTGSRSSRR